MEGAVPFLCVCVAEAINSQKCPFQIFVWFLSGLHLFFQNHMPY